MINSERFIEIADDVKALYKKYETVELQYHNLKHTESVVNRTYEIANTYTFSADEMFTLAAAAWFHDTGHLFGNIEGHEERSVSIMKDHLLKNQIPNNVIDSIEGCILATKLPHNPKNILQSIICDADTYNLGTNEFLNTDKLLQREFKLRNIPSENWEKFTLDLLEKHKYFTPYCQSLLNKGKQKNIETLLGK